MAEIKLTKSELRLQQNRLIQLQKYLPTLQLKKAMLQVEVQEARTEIVQMEALFAQCYSLVEGYSALLVDQGAIDPLGVTKVKGVTKLYENIAGIEVPHFQGIVFEDFIYNLFDTPPWVDAAIAGLRSATEARAKVEVAREKKSALEKELREVSIRVNLFEKILIPRALKNIKRIKVFLGDQQLAAVSQAKVAKSKIESNNRLARLQKSTLLEVVYAH